jgi:hypothetical protein
MSSDYPGHPGPALPSSEDLRKSDSPSLRLVEEGEVVLLAEDDSWLPTRCGAAPDSIRLSVLLAYPEREVGTNEISVFDSAGVTRAESIGPPWTGE